MGAMKLAATLLSLVSLCSAAPWDGARGDLSIRTEGFDAGKLLGLSWAIPSTAITVTSTDATVTAFRVTIQIRNVVGQLEDRVEVVRVAPFPFAASANFLGVQESVITAIRITRLRDGESTDLPLN